MKPVTACVLVFCTVILTSIPVRSQELGAEQLNWLSGYWTAELGETVVEEVWLPAAGDTMVGVNRTVRGDASVTFEFLRIAREGGLLVYLASPGGRFPPTAFPLVELAEDRVVFNNPNHDFPRRISYVREADQLTATIEGRISGEDLTLSWHFHNASLQPAAEE